MSDTVGIVPVKRYWKISPGGAGKFWSEFRDRSLIAMHWSHTKVDLSGFPESQIEFFTRAKLEMDISNQGAKSLWDLSRVMKIGDGVLAYANQTVLAHGIVTGDYQFVEDEFYFPHRRSVTWTSLDPLPIATLSVPLQTKLKTQATLFELTKDQFLLATRQQDPPTLGQTSPLDLVLEQFAASGLHYSQSQIATFYTALQTKGFVVLSGISGTGKSKIATGFVEMLPVSTLAPEPERTYDGITPIEVKTDTKKNRRIFIPSRYHDLLPPMERGTSFHVPVFIDGEQGTGRFWLRNLPNSNSYLLRFHQMLSPKIQDWTIGSYIYLELILNSEGDKVAEIRITSNPPESNINDDHPIDPPMPGARNHLFLSVRPDWRDSTSLLGYYNPLTQTYEWTEFLRFIIRAQESYLANDGLAWFVILDEMNLAHVEYYFADLLSVIESGRDPDGWTREPIRLTYPDTLDDEVPPRELKLPPNLYIIGTVNMDETTHAFSPKVLDRAFTIELTDVDFLNYKIDIGPEITHLDDTTKRHLLDQFTRRDPATSRSRFAQISKEEIAAIVHQEPLIRTYLDALNRQLQYHRFHFGYRVFDEIAQYLFNNHLNGMMPFISAFDQAVLMKVLPKFTGSRARLRTPLLSLLAWTFAPDNPASARLSTQQQFESLNPDDSTAVTSFTTPATFHAVASRATQMLLALETDGFVSFG